MDVLLPNCRKKDADHDAMFGLAEEEGESMITIVFVVLIIVAAAMFSAQNAAPVAVSFLSAHLEASLAIVVILAFFAGMIMGMLLLSWMRLRRSMRKKKESRSAQTKIINN